MSDDEKRPSDKLLKILPDLRQRLGVEDLESRIEVFDLLVVSNPKRKLRRYEMLYDLPASDYEFVLGRILEGLGATTSEEQVIKLLDSVPIWAFVIKGFHLNRTTSQCAELLSRENLYVRFFALQLLAELDAKVHEQAIAKILSAESKDIRDMARAILLGWKSKEVVPTLIEDLKKRNQRYEFEAIEALKQIGDPSAIPALLEYARDLKGRHPRPVLLALRELIPKDQQVQLLTPIIRQIAKEFTDREIVSYALSLSIDYRDTEMIVPVIERLKSLDETTRSVMSNALSETSNEVLVPAIREALDSPQIYGDSVAANESIRAGMIALLRSVGSPAAIIALRKAIADSDRFIQHAAIDAVKHLGTREAVGELIPVLRTENATAAALALVRMRDRRSLPALREYLSKPGVVDSNFVYGFNEAYSSEPHKKLKTTHLQETIQGRPDDVLKQLSQRFSVPIQVHGDELQFASISEKTDPVHVYSGEDVDNSIGRALYYLNQNSTVRYCRILKGDEVHVMSLADAPQFIRLMLERDFY